MNDLNLQNAEFLGVENQMVVLIEELSELSQAAAKWLRCYQLQDPTLRKSGDAIMGELIEELADVSLVIDQIKHLLGVSERMIHGKRREKIWRTAEAIKAEKKRREP